MEAVSAHSGRAVTSLRVHFFRLLDGQRTSVLDSDLVAGLSKESGSSVDADFKISRWRSWEVSPEH